MIESKCPNVKNHAKCPEGYLQWHAWADKKSKTHYQTECPGCGKLNVWLPKKKGHAYEFNPGQEVWWCGCVEVVKMKFVSEAHTRGYYWCEFYAGTTKVRAQDVFASEADARAELATRIKTRETA